MTPRLLLILLAVLDTLLLYSSTPLPQDSLPAQRSDSLSAEGDLTGEAGLSAKRSDSVAVYEGINLKLDLFTPVLELARSKGKVQNYEIGVSCRLKQRYYPTLELGYARATIDADGAHHFGQGGFFRAGVDLNGLKKRPERLNALLVGIRIGTAIQQYQLTDITVTSPFWFGNEPYRFDLDKKVGTDCWGEVVFGCQVQVYKGFQMGWNLRLKLLMTRTAKDGGGLPAYIPGYGFRDDTNWGINYTIGYYFR